MVTPSLQQFTVGVEEEYMVLDPSTKELKSHQQTIVNEGQKLFKDKIKAEMHQAVVEVGTGICKNVDEAFSEIIELRNGVHKIAGDLGYSIGASGTHPFSLWETQLVSDQSRYQELLNELQQAARSNLIFGLHVHVGMEDRRMAIHIANTARYFLPHIYALSTNSPFWETRNTGYKSYRSKVFDKFPRTGIPDTFESIEAYDSFIQLLIKTNCIDDAKKIWKKFERGNRSAQINPNGSGLGLYLAKQIMLKHGGDISVHSAGFNKGSKFTLLIPKDIIHKAPPESLANVSTVQS